MYASKQNSHGPNSCLVLVEIEQNLKRVLQLNTYKRHVLIKSESKAESNHHLSVE
jgi:hypothetical protein